MKILFTPNNILKQMHDVVVFGSGSIFTDLFIIQTTICTTCNRLRALGLRADCVCGLMFIHHTFITLAYRHHQWNSIMITNRMLSCKILWVIYSMKWDKQKYWDGWSPRDDLIKWEEKNFWPAFDFEIKIRDSLMKHSVASD